MTTQPPFTFPVSLPCSECGGTQLVDGVLRHDAALIAIYTCDNCGTVMVIPNAPQIKATAGKSVSDGSMRPILLLLQSESKIAVPAGYFPKNGDGK